MNSGWVKATLGDFVKLQRGHDLPKSQRRTGSVPVIGSAGITGYHDTARAKGPGVTVGRSGASFGEVNYSPVDYWPHNAALYVTDFKGNHERFAYYFLKSLNFKSFNSGSAQQSLNRNFIYPIPVSIPPLEIQRRIATLLSAYDDLIENNTRRIQILEEIARRVFEEWFVGFRFPGHENVKMIESELGSIPEGWEVVSVSDIANFARGKSYKSSELSEADDGLPFVNLKCIDRDGGFRKSGLKRFIGSYKESQRVYQGDVVVAVTDMTQERRIVARSGRVPKLDTEFGIVSMDLVKMIPKPGYSKEYIYSMLRWSGFADEVKQHANGANVLHLLPDRILDYRLPNSEGSLIDEFTIQMQSALSLIDVLNEKNEKLRLTRDLLLPKLISGEIDVSNFPEPVSD